MREIELKFQVPLARRAALEAAVAGRAATARTRLQAAYFDTAARALAMAGLALRLRREGRQWVQTLKGATAEAMTRFEHNVPRGGAVAMPPVDAGLHAGTPAGEALRVLLARDGVGTLAIVYRTDVLRRARALRTPHGRVELAFDAGSIRAGNAKLDVRELEIELVAGSSLAVLDTARRWVPRFGLWLDVRGKAERGDLLARGEAMAPPRLALPVALDATMSAAQAWRAVLRSCADQVVANASQVASGEHADEHVHQLRVGLRRLRSALALFEGVAEAVALGEAAAALFRRLGTARDAAVLDAEFAAELAAAMRSAGIADDTPMAPASNETVSSAGVLREAGSQVLMLDLLAAVHAADDVPGHGDGLHKHLAMRLKRWHRQLVADAKRFADLDDAARHRLRKRAKRLRYATEFCAGLFERRAVRRYLRALRGVQERLGALSDVAMAMGAYAGRREIEPRAMFALGWLAARREVLIAGAAPDLKALIKAPRFFERD